MVLAELRKRAGGARFALRGGRNGPPESRPQLKELRSGEWVMQPVAQGRRGDRTRPARAV